MTTENHDCQFTEWSAEDGYSCPCGEKAGPDDLLCVVCGSSGHPDIWAPGLVSCGRNPNDA